MKHDHTDGSWWQAIKIEHADRIRDLTPPVTPEPIKQIEVNAHTQGHPETVKLIRETLERRKRALGTV